MHPNTVQVSAHHECWQGVGSDKPDICSLPWIFERKRNLRVNEKETHKMLYSSYLKIYVSIRSSSLLKAASKMFSNGESTVASMRSWSRHDTLKICKINLCNILHSNTRIRQILGFSGGGGQITWHASHLINVQLTKSTGKPKAGNTGRHFCANSPPPPYPAALGWGKGSEENITRLVLGKMSKGKLGQETHFSRFLYYDSNVTPSDC